jgi:7,8-dihydro-6-hydroxymethylpterin-pyrophosphokinase
VAHSRTSYCRREARWHRKRPQAWAERLVDDTLVDFMARSMPRERALLDLPLSYTRERLGQGATLEQIRKEMCG